MDFKGRDVVSIRDFSEDEIVHILTDAERWVEVARGNAKSEALRGKVMASMFFEPSTRTRMSFETAMCRHGGKVVSITGAEGTSLVKGETLADTVRMAAAYADVIVLRHPHEGAARLAAEFSGVPVLNGGDGAGQHPTQTLLDLFTIHHRLGEVKGSKVAIIGDLKFGRTAHSLSYALALMGAKVTLVSPPSLQMPSEFVEQLGDVGVKPTVTDDLKEAASGVDVLYVTRIQKERFPDVTEYKKVAGIYKVDAGLLKSCKENVIVMHPLPRVDEISPEVDGLPNAAYFEQAFNGVPIRMSILGLVLGANGGGGA
jgi:aspartate carbamoyltransferase catalytic subunit